MSYRTKQIVSLMGSFTFSRPYYHCSTCRHGHFPWDGTLRLTEQRLSPAAREVVSLAGVHESFGKAADRSLEKMAGLRLSESTVQRTTEAAGRQAGERLEQAPSSATCRRGIGIATPTARRAPTSASIGRAS